MSSRRAIVAMLVVATLVPLTAPPAAAQDPNWVCGAYDQSAKRGRTPTPDAGGKTFPLVTIHGITGSDDDFDKTIDKSTIGANPQPPRSLLDAFAGPKTPGQTLPPGLDHMRVYSFSYTPDSLRWVDNPAVGGRFAATIDCLYQRHGVPVSVVAHSMGGLVTRWVANTTDAAGVPRATKLGKVVTLGTPYEGSVLSAVANGVTDAVSLANPAVLLLNYLCGKHGTETGEGSCGVIPLYSSFRSEAGRNLIAGSAALGRVARWPAQVDVSDLAGAQFVPYNLFGSPLNAAVDIGDVVVPTASATADPGRGKVFECRYDSAATSARTRLAEVLRLADPVERRRKLGGAFFASPCYHGNLMRHVELTNEVLGELTEWTSARAPRVTLGGYGPITLGMDEQAAVAAGSLKVERAPYCSLPGVAFGTLYSMPAATDPRIEVVTDAGKVVRIRARGAWTTDFGVSRGENAEALARRFRAAGWTVTISGESSAFGPGIVEASKGAATFTVYADEAGNVGNMVDIPRPVYCD